MPPDEDRAASLRVEAGSERALGCSRLVARGPALGQLLEALSGRPAVAVVAGEAGAGKTRLVAEGLRSSGIQQRYLTGKAWAFDGRFSLGPIIEALSSLRPELLAEDLNPVAGAAQPLLPELQHVLPPPPRPLADPKAERHRLFRALAAILDAVGDNVLVLEDLHWADPATEEFVCFLVSRIPDRLRVVLTWRPEEVDRSSPLRGIRSLTQEAARVAYIRLPLLDPDGVREMASDILDVDAMSDEFVDYLTAKTGGLPFAVEEVLGLLRQRRDLIVKGGTWARRELEDLQVPPRLKDWILERRTHLSSAARDVLDAASVLERPSTLAAFEHLTGLAPDDVRMGTVTALASGLLHEVRRTTYAFRHELGRRAIYEDIPGPERLEMHARAADFLGSDRRADHHQLAHHFKNSGQAASWMKHAEAAADRSESIGDFATAARLLQEVFHARVGTAQERASLAFRFGRCALRGLAHEEAIESFRGLLKEQGLDAETKAEVRTLLAMAYDQRGDSSACYRHLAIARESLFAKPLQLARIESSLALPWAKEVHVDDHLRSLSEARRLAREVNDEQLSAWVAVDGAILDAYRAAPGSVQQALQLVRRETDLVEVKHHYLRAAVISAPAALLSGHLEGCAELLREAERLATELGGNRFPGMLEATKILLAFERGEWETLRERSEELLSTRDAVPCFVWPCHLTLGSLALASGDFGTAERHLRDALEIAPRAGSVAGQALAGARLTRLKLAEGQTAAAREAATGSWEALERKGILTWAYELLPELVACLIAENDVAGAEIAIDRFLQATASSESPHADLAAALAQGRTRVAAYGGEDSAIDVFEPAWSLIDGGSPYKAALVSEERGRHLFGTEPSAAAELLRNSFETFRRLGAEWDLRRLRSTLRTAGLEPPHRRGRKGYGDRLSPRERDVVRLVVAGRTNREIAELLFVSPRTVEDHVSRALRKQGVESRSALRI